MPILPEDCISTDGLKSDACLWVLLAINILTPGPVHACGSLYTREIRTSACTISVNVAEYRGVPSPSQLQPLNSIFVEPVEVVVHIVLVRVLNDL